MVSAAPFISTPASGLIKPLLRTAMIRKFDDTDFASDLLVPPASPGKKARVSFDPNVEKIIMSEYEVKAKGRSLDAVRLEVRRAIEGHSRGDSERYDIIKEVFSRKDKHGEEPDEEKNNVELKTYVLALTSYASLLNRECSGLVKVVINCEWVGREEGFVKAYILFLGSLISAHGAYLKMVMDMLVKLFSNVKVSRGRLPGCPNVNRKQLASRVHGALKYLLRLIPSGSATLSPLLVANFPVSDDSTKVHITYIENLIRVADYATELKSEILASITDRLVQIDVQMQVDLDDLDDEVASAIVHALSLDINRHEENDHEVSDSDMESITSDEAPGTETLRITEVRNNVGKMDAILDLLFKNYTPYFADPNSVEAARMFEILLGHFANIMLPTYRSRHTQFILFHFAQTAEHLVDQFAGTCVQLAFQPSRPAVLRQSAAAYLASFVARGAHVQPHVVRTVFDLIGNNLDHIRAENERNCQGPDLKRYSTFYAMTQALLYIFCFRWRDLIISTEILEEEDPLAFVHQDLTWVAGIKETLSRTIYSKLNPLKICSPPIVAEFAKIAHHLKFLYVYPLLESNKRVRLSHSTSAHGSGALRDASNGDNQESWHQLDGYFPFDPYQLPASKHWLEGDYVQWKGVPGLTNDDDDDEDIESGDDESEVDADAEDDDTTSDVES